VPAAIVREQPANSDVAGGIWRRRNVRGINQCHLDRNVSQSDTGVDGMTKGDIFL